MKTKSSIEVGLCQTAQQLRMPMPNGYSIDASGKTHGPAQVDPNDDYRCWLIEQTLKLWQLDRLESIGRWVKFFGILTILGLVFTIFFL